MSDSIDNDLPFTELGHFRIVARIGHGGMGDVYKGYEEALDRTVAIKVLPTELARQEDFVRRFRAEATAVARINHPNVVPIHYIGEDQGHHFFAMQFVEGESLADLLDRRGRLTSDETVAIIEQVLSGLTAAHQQGIVHRDIKPGNILLDRENRQALLADFGLVKSIEGSAKMTATGVIMGTVDYISPEQGRGQDVDARSDLYSIGVLMYQMLSGNLPFEADSPTSMIFQHVYEPPKPLSEIVSEAPPALCAVVHRLLAKSPDDRHQTADQVLADLRAFRSGQPLPSLAKSIAMGPKASEAVAAARSQTQVIQAPRFDETPPLPIELPAEAPLKWWRRGRNRLQDFLRGRAPELVQRLQNTQQQVDGAVAEHERRRDRLQQLVSEAEAVQRELKQQAENCRQGAAEAERRAESAVDDDGAQEALEEKTACLQSADGLSQQIAEQKTQLEAMQLRLAQVNATLQKVRSQRDILNARLKVAQAQVDLAARSPQRAMLRRVLPIGAVVAACALIILASVFFWPGDKPPGPSSVAASEFGEQVVRFEAKPECLAFLPRRTPEFGFGFATGNADGTVNLFHIGHDGLVQPGGHMFGHIDEINAISFSPDGTRFATASKDETIRVWETWGDSRSKALRCFEPHVGPITAVRFSPDGNQLLAGSQRGMIQLWDVRTQAKIKESKVNSLRSWIETMDWSRDGTMVLLGTRVNGEDSMSLWSLVDGWEEVVFDTSDQPAWTVTFSDSESQAYSRCSGSIRVYDLTSGEVVRQFGEGIRAAAFSPSVHRAWSADQRGRLQLWDVETGDEVQGFTTHLEGIYQVDLSRDGTKGISASHDGTIRVWDLALPSSPDEN